AAASSRRALARQRRACREALAGVDWLESPGLLLVFLLVPAMANLVGPVLVIRPAVQGARDRCVTGVDRMSASPAIAVRIVGAAGAYDRCVCLTVPRAVTSSRSQSVGLLL